MSQFWGNSTLSEASIAKPPRLPLLDGLRGIAAIAVVFHHEPGIYGSHGLFPRAYLAVDFFFMLSGFVLTLAYERRLQSGLTSLAFMRLRIARLWPVLAVGIIIAGLGKWGIARSWLPLTDMCMGLLLIPVLSGNNRLYQLNGPQWSISFELIANAAHALVLRRLSNGALLILALGFGFLLAFQGWHWGSLASGDVVHNWWGGFARVGFSYCVGIWLGRRFCGYPAPPIAWGFAALPLPFILLTAPLWPFSRFAGDCLAVFVVMPPALWIAAHARVPVWARPALGWLGQISYPIYALHAPVLVLAGRYIHPLPLGAQMPARAGALALTFALAYLLAISPLAKGGWPTAIWRPAKLEPAQLNR